MQQAKEKHHHKGVKKGMSLEQLLSKVELSNLEKYILELSKQREPSWEVIVFHQKVDENTARGSLAKLQTAMFTELTKKLREKQGALLGKCDTLYAALQLALNLHLIANSEYTRGIRINSATNMAKHRVEPDHKVIKDNKKKNLNDSDSDQEGELGVSEDEGSDQKKKLSDSDGSEQKEPIEKLNVEAGKLNLKGNKQKFFKEHESSDEESSDKDIFAQKFKGGPKEPPAENLVAKLKQERMNLQHELIEAILRSDLPAVMKLINERGASITGHSFRERYHQIADWFTKFQQSKSHNNRHNAQVKFGIVKIPSVSYQQVICPLTAAAISLNEEIFNYVQQHFGNEFNWNLVCADFLISCDLTDLVENGSIPGLYRYQNRQRPIEISDAVTAPDPNDDIAIIILMDNLLYGYRGRVKLNSFERIYSIYDAHCKDKIEIRPETATYEWLAKWYETNARETWVPAYNQAIFGNINVSWSTVIQTLMNDKKLFDVVGARNPGHKWDDVNKKNAVIPFPAQHDRVVANILGRMRLIKGTVIEKLKLCEKNYYSTLYKEKMHHRPGAEILASIDKMLPDLLEAGNLKLLKFGSFKIESNNRELLITYTASPHYPVILEPSGRSKRPPVALASPTKEQLAADIERNMKWFCDILYIRNSTGCAVVVASLGYKSPTIKCSSDPAILEYLLQGLQRLNIVGELISKGPDFQF